MAIHIEVDNYKPKVSRKGVPYIAFNIRVTSDEGVGFVSCDWRLQGGLLYPPYKVTGPARFFTCSYLSETVARMVYEQAQADLELMAEDNPELIMNREKNGWRSAVYSDTLLRNILPSIVEEEGGCARPAVQGKKRKVWEPQVKPVGVEEEAPVAAPSPAKVFGAVDDVAEKPVLAPFEDRLKHFLETTPERPH